MSSDKDEDDTLQQLRDLDTTRERIEEMRIPSLCDGFDEKSLMALDGKLNLWFLKEEQEDSRRKPTDAEIQHYEKSITLRMAALRKASKHQVVIDRLSNRDHANGYIYEEFHQDMKKYPYAWLGIIFDRKEHLVYACSALQVLKNLAWLKYESQEVALFKSVMELYGEALEMFQTAVSDAEDKEYYEHVGAFKWERYELSAFAAQWMALATYKSEAIQYFQEALTEEYFWEYPERHCRKLLEDATGSTMSTDDLINIETMEEDEGDEFVWKCLLAWKAGEKGIVQWLPTRFCQDCGEKETNDKKLLRCSRCLRAFYCTKECQKRDWSDHKHDCKK
jgi:tetratricopeptide (TPR) repeat protein